MPASFRVAFGCLVVVADRDLVVHTARYRAPLLLALSIGLMAIVVVVFLLLRLVLVLLMLTMITMLLILTNCVIWLTADAGTATVTNGIPSWPWLTGVALAAPCCRLSSFVAGL